MKENVEISPDLEINNQMNIYFTFLRKQTGKCSVPSKIDSELHKIAYYSIQTLNPIFFLQKNGLILFDKCCGINLSLLSKAIHSCRSRISECFRREGWASSFPDDKIYKQHMRTLLPASELKFWSLRKYPLESIIYESISQYPQILRINPIPAPVQNEKKIEECPFELTLQKDIFCWTLLDDL